MQLGTYGFEIGHEFTGRGLDALAKKIGEGLTDAIVARRLGSAYPSLRLLEIGCGEGRLLMELRARYPEAEIRGLNDDRWPSMEGQGVLRRVADFYNIPEPQSPEPVPLPVIEFGDASKLPFGPEYFDLVISQAAIPFVSRKDRVIEEVLRVLRPGGEAHLHLDSTTRERGETTPRFVIQDGPDRPPVLEHIMNRFKDLADVRLDLVDIETGGCFTILRIRKHAPGTADLGLVFQSPEAAVRESFPWGVQSVFTPAPA